MNIYRLNKIQKIEMAKIGTSHIYMRCASCESENIAGYIGTGKSLMDIAIIDRKAAVYCKDCLNKISPAPETEREKEIRVIMRNAVETRNIRKIKEMIMDGYMKFFQEKTGFATIEDWKNA